jgi:hypothetical protein
MSKKLLSAALAAAVLATASLALQAQQTDKPVMKKGGGCCSAEDTAGWNMMSAEEQKAHRQKMAGMKDSDSCMAYMKEHHTAMETRAKEKGMKMGKYGGYGCDHLKKKS